MKKNIALKKYSLFLMQQSSAMYLTMHLEKHFKLPVTIKMEQTTVAVLVELNLCKKNLINSSIADSVRVQKAGRSRTIARRDFPILDGQECYIQQFAFTLFADFSKLNKVELTLPGLAQEITIHQFRESAVLKLNLASERDAIRGNTIENRGYLFVYICVCGHMYVILYFDPRIFVFASWSTPSHTSTKHILLVQRSCIIQGNVNATRCTQVLKFTVGLNTVQ